MSAVAEAEGILSKMIENLGFIGNVSIRKNFETRDKVIRRELRDLGPSGRIPLEEIRRSRPLGTD